jgi:hypothetical protein
LEERIEAVEAIGFTRRQARFLVLVALHSGYCLRRQYAAFAGVAYGKNVRDFLDSLVAKHLAERFSIRADRGHLYHLRARPFYRVLGQEHNRNRREVSAALVARKLMMLDFVLSQSEVEWIAAEEDKVQLFAERLNVSRADMPQRVFAPAEVGGLPTTRYFPHKLPVAIAGDPPVVRFMSLVTDTTGSGLEQFLQNHAALFRCLSAWSVVAVGPSASLRLADPEGAFAHFLRSPVMSPSGHTDDLRWYFTSRRSVDAGDLSRMSMEDIDRFRQLRALFTGAANEALYRAWTARGDEVLASTTAGRKGANSVVGRLIVEPLPFDYSQFGSLPGVA